MYHYGFVPSQCYSIMFLPPSTYSTYRPGRYAGPPRHTMFPPIQMNNFNSRPYTYAMANGTSSLYPEDGRLEYHHFYGMNPNFNSNFNLSPNWYFPPVNPPAAYNPYANYHNPTSMYEGHQRLHPDAWPEGFTLRGELHWGKLERIFGPKREVPDFVKDDLRRVYGTYPRTSVIITYQNGEFLVKGDPKVGEQEYTVEKKVIRRDPTSSEMDEDSVRESRNKKKTRKSKR